jgi:hypothetical protein
VIDGWRRRLEATPSGHRARLLETLAAEDVRMRVRRPSVERSNRAGRHRTAASSSSSRGRHD